jgi:hypothetical protein
MIGGSKSKLKTIFFALLQRVSSFHQAAPQHVISNRRSDRAKLLNAPSPNGLSHRNLELFLLPDSLENQLIFSVIPLQTFQTRTNLKIKKPRALETESIETLDNLTLGIGR